MSEQSKETKTAVRGGVRITTLLTLGMVAVLAFAIGLITLVDVQRQRRIFKEQLTEKGIWLARTLNDVLADGLYFKDVERLRHLSEVAADQPEVLSVVVFEADGRVIVATDEHRFPSGTVGEDLIAYVKRREPTILEDDEVVQVVGAVTAGSVILGGVKIEFDATPIRAQVRETIVQHLWQGGVVMLMGMALAWGVARSLVRGVRELVDVTRRFKEGDYRVSVGAKRGDEIGDLALALEEMSARLVQVEEERIQREQQLEAVDARIRGEASSRKRAQLGKQEATERLSQTIAELEDTQERLRRFERLSSIGEITAGMVHDVRNSLQIVLGATSSILLNPSRLDSPDDVRAALGTVEAAVRSASGILERVRKFHAKADQPEVDIVVDIRKIVEDAIALAEPCWKTGPLLRGVEIQMRTYLKDVPRTSADAVEIEQLVLNLLFNSIQSMPRGGTITVRLAPHSGIIRLEVQDDGVGMSSEVRDHCLEPFFTTRGDEGTGLGLSLVADVAARYAGSVDVESEEGHGTKVVVEIPPRHGRTAGATLEATAPPVRSLAVLCVDDDDLVRTSLMAYLRYDSHSVDLAASGVEALEKLDPSRHDVVVCNRAMPGMSGDEVASRILEISPEIPVILLTGSDGAMTALRLKPPGVDMVLVKPITLAALRTALSEVVSSRGEPAGRRGS